MATKATATLALSAILGACASPTEAPTSPNLGGVVYELTRYSLAITYPPHDAEIDVSGDVSFYLRKTGKLEGARFANIQLGDSVRVWVSGGVAESERPKYEGAYRVEIVR